MKDYLPVEESLQEVFRKAMPLMPAQIERIARLCTALLLAGTVQLSYLARQLKGECQQDSRIRWIQRLLEARFLSQELVYQPVLQVALARFQSKCWHLVIDRTTLNGQHRDVVTLALNYHKRAIPLVWQLVPFGGTDVQTHCDLIQRCVPLIPKDVQVVLHGDTEFGAVALIRVLQALGWDFILAQKASDHIWRPGATQSEALRTLPVTRQQSVCLEHIELAQQARLGPLNLLAFWSPRYSGGHQRRPVTYLVTSLPLTRSLKRVGRRRWGTEPFYRDLKSAGWQMPTSQLGDQRLQGLFVIMALTYLWSVCIGRWLCKRGLRQLVDRKPRRHLSLFRLGWDWLVHTLRMAGLSPPFLSLYS
jgi:hypothetical protein